MGDSWLLFRVCTVCRAVKAIITSDAERSKISSMLETVRKEFILSTNANSRKGGLLALAATAIAVGQVSHVGSAVMRRHQALAH